MSAELVWTILGAPRHTGAAPTSGDLWGRDGDTWRGGALELSARYDGLWLGRSEDDLTQGGSQGGALALKWWPTSFVAATLASYLTRYEAAAIERPDALWSWGLLARASFFWQR